MLLNGLMKSSKTNPYLNLMTSGVVNQQSLKDFQKRIDFRFKSLSLLINAFVHRSFADDLVKSNERLEFLGDSVLSLVISTYLFNRFPQNDEGYLTQHRSLIVCENSLYEIACELGMENLLILGKSERQVSKRFHKSIVADSVEALIGAIYLDSGWNAASRFILKVFSSRLNESITSFSHIDPKTRLQMFVQKQWKTLPRYRIVQKTGPDHDLCFSVEVSVQDEVYGVGSGSSRKEAEIQAAEKAILHFQEKNLWIEKSLG